MKYLTNFYEDIQPVKEGSWFLIWISIITALAAIGGWRYVLMPELIDQQNYTGIIFFSLTMLWVILGSVITIFIAVVSLRKYKLNKVEA